MQLNVCRCLLGKNGNEWFMSEKSHKVEENLQLVNKLSLLIITQKKNFDFIT